MFTPAAVDSRQQSPGVRVENEPDAGAPPVLSLCRAVIDVFPGGTTVVRLAGGKPIEVATRAFHEIDGIELVGDQSKLVVKRDRCKGGGEVTVCEIGEPFLQGATER